MSTELFGQSFKLFPKMVSLVITNVQGRTLILPLCVVIGRVRAAMTFRCLALPCPPC